MLSFSCGLDDYPVVYPIPQSNITQTLNQSAVVRIPTDNDPNTTVFSHFVIFYRIYVSKQLVSSSTFDSPTLTAINPVLNSDYNAFFPYIGSTTQVNTNMDSLFGGRKYKTLFLDGPDIDSVLSAAVLGTTLQFNFPDSASGGQLPTMTIGSNVYTLWRSNRNGPSFTSPRPDRNFVNNADLYNSQFIDPAFNADVENLSGITDQDTHYTYAAMYIAAAGIDPTTYSFIYSTPALINIFRLPEPH